MQLCQWRRKSDNFSSISLLAACCKKGLLSVKKFAPSTPDLLADPLQTWGRSCLGNVGREEVGWEKADPPQQGSPSARFLLSTFSLLHTQDISPLC